jgi:hypothetical protein
MGAEALEPFEGFRSLQVTSWSRGGYPDQFKRCAPCGKDHDHYHMGEMRPFISTATFLRGSHFTRGWKDRLDGRRNEKDDSRPHSQQQMRLSDDGDVTGTCLRKLIVKIIPHSVSKRRFAPWLSEQGL